MTVSLQMLLVYCQHQPLLARVAGTEGVGRGVTAVCGVTGGKAFPGAVGREETTALVHLASFAFIQTTGIIYTNYWNHRCLTVPVQSPKS